MNIDDCALKVFEKKSYFYCINAINGLTVDDLLKINLQKRDSLRVKRLERRSRHSKKQMVMINFWKSDKQQRCNEILFLLGSSQPMTRIILWKI